MQRIILIMLLAAATFAGCTARQVAESDYERIVYHNGINHFEAEAIAYHYLFNSVYKSYYDIFSLEIRKDPQAKKYSGYWFVHFSPAAHHETKSFLVVIDKANGNILTAEGYVPHIQTALDWVFRKRN